MEEVEFIVEQAEMVGWKLWLAVRVKGTYDLRVRNPKLAVTFDSGTQTRRVPLLLHSYSEKKDGSYVLYAKYSYNVKNIFFKEPLTEKITLHFSYMYGELEIDQVTFKLGDQLVKQYALENGEDSEQTEEYAVTDDGLEEEEDDTLLHYDISFPETRDAIELHYLDKIEEQTAMSKAVHAVRGFFGWLWKVVQFFLGICLLPIFFIDAVLAALGCVPKKGGIGTGNKIIYIIKHARWRLTAFCRVNIGILPMKLYIMKKLNRFASLFPVHKDRIVFLSNRRTDLSGNFEFVYNQIKDNKNLDIRFVLDDKDVRHMKFSNMLRIAVYFANSKIILVDDFMELLFKMPRRENTYLFQLWHACGAFKTFGCSRLGKKGGQTLKSPNHRNYDYATVSSQEIAKFYAEGFGLSLEKVVATGVPRTDIFFDEAYKQKVTEEFYQKYPKLREKKILLFAPTFRGNGKNSGYYPIDLFDVNKLYEDLNEEYAIIIKHHPFVHDRNKIYKKYKDYIIDLSENSELNDLLFVTDLLITDYSSVVFEASLLNIPMLFYVFDLEQYIASRGFYYEYETFVPGVIIHRYKNIAKAILSGELGQEKLEPFKNRFFDGRDGKSTERTVNLIYDCMKR